MCKEQNFQLENQLVNKEFLLGENEKGMEQLTYVTNYTKHCPLWEPSSRLAARGIHHFLCKWKSKTTSASVRLCSASWQTGMERGTRWRISLRQCATSQKVAGSTPDEMIQFF